MGMIERTEEYLIGTSRGVVKCRTGKRNPPGEQWDAEALVATRGTT